MTDYSKMSDFDISKRVLISLGYKPAYEDESCISYLSSNDRKDVGDGGVKRFKYDPCNNPADAWPIITENNISLIFDNPSSVMATSNCVGWYSDEQPPIHSSSNNPLRAAMIVFLMMKDSENA